jgi:hypothetical protein
MSSHLPQCSFAFPPFPMCLGLISAIPLPLASTHFPFCFCCCHPFHSILHILLLLSNSIPPLLSPILLYWHWPFGTSMPTFRRSFQRHPIPSEFGMKATQRESHRTNCGLFIHSLKGESWEWKENNRILFWFSEPFEVVFLFILVTTFLAWIAFWPIVVLFREDCPLPHISPLYQFHF